MQYQSDQEHVDRTAAASGGCEEFVQAERRRWMQAARQHLLGRGDLLGRGGRSSAAAATAGVTQIPTAMPRVGVSASGGPTRDILVFVMLRGGMDGLSLCVPHADPDYAWQRDTLAVPPPGQLHGVTDLDGFFGLAESASALLPAYLAGDLAFIQNAGSTDPTRSHFDQMKFIEGGVPNQGASLVTSGWLGRHLAGTQATDPAASLRGLAMAFNATLTLAGGPKTLSIPSLADFQFEGSASTTAARQAVLHDLYERESDALRSAAEATLDTLDVFGGIDFANYVPSGGAMYPAGEFGERFKSAAALIKADVGVETIEIDRSRWDHHDDLGPIDGKFAAMAQELSQTLAAFREDLGSLMGNVTVVALSEFGRRVDANGARGTDHGRGGCMLVMGGNVNGGQVVRDWVGLDPLVLDDLALPVRIDYRDILIEILTKRVGNVSAGALFPNHAFTDWGIVN